MADICCPADSDQVAAVAADLLGCLGDALDQCGRPVCRLSLVPGGAPVAHDVCCQCCTEDGDPADGQGWVRLETVYPFTQFPVPTGDAQRCGGWAATYELGLVRCVSTLSDGGDAPCAADLTGDARKVMADAAVLRRVVSCCLDEDTRAVFVEPWEPVGPQGGCAGGQLRVTVSVSEPGCR